MYFCLSILPSLKHKIILLLKHSCVEFASIKLQTMRKSNQEIGKTRNFLRASKSYWASRTGIGGRKKKEVIINRKTATLSNSDKWKKKQEDQGGKYIYFFIYKLTLIEWLFYHLQFTWNYLIKNVLLQVLFWKH